MKKLQWTDEMRRDFEAALRSREKRSDIAARFGTNSAMVSCVTQYLGIERPTYTGTQSKDFVPLRCKEIDGVSLFDALASGMTAGEAAKAYGISEGYVYQLARKRGIALTKAKWTRGYSHQTLEVIEFLKSHTQTEAANHFGMTRQRVSQIAKRSGLTPPRKGSTMRCPKCGGPTRRWKAMCAACRKQWESDMQVSKICKQCGKPFEVPRRTIRNPETKQGSRYKQPDRPFCSPECYGASVTRKREVACPVCGTMRVQHNNVIDRYQSKYGRMPACSNKCARVLAIETWRNNRN